MNNYIIEYIIREKGGADTYKQTNKQTNKQTHKGRLTKHGNEAGGDDIRERDRQQ